MAVPKAQYTTLVAPRGRLVHAIGHERTRTGCGRDFSGWRIVPAEVDCPRCLRALGIRRGPT